MKNKTKLLLSAIAAIIVIGLVVLVLYLKSVQNYQDKVAAINITDIDLSTIPDGTYTGEYDVDYIFAKVEVTIKDGTISDIHLLEHKNGEGKPAERIIDDVIAAQSLNVDTVSGATNSSKVIKKAIENALLQ